MNQFKAIPNDLIQRENVPIGKSIRVGKVVTRHDVTRRTLTPALHNSATPALQDFEKEFATRFALQNISNNFAPQEISFDFNEVSESQATQQRTFQLDFNEEQSISEIFENIDF